MLIEINFVIATGQAVIADVYTRVSIRYVSCNYVPLLNDVYGSCLVEDGGEFVAEAFGLPV